MPTMPERMAVVETQVKAIDVRTTKTDKNVDLLVAWMHEERGAHKEREKTRRRDKAFLGTVASVLGAIGGALFSAITGGKV